MNNRAKLPLSFSKFSWLVGILCLPTVLWPLSAWISPYVSEANALGDNTNFAVFFMWAYPVLLLCIALLLHKIRKNYASLAIGLLALSYVLIYSVIFYIVKYAITPII